nr:transcription antitermination protein NusB [uncultured Brumimicrobium sp.]
MLNRRHLRIKVLQTLYAFSQHEDKEFLWAKKELFKAVNQMYELYISLLMIFPELKHKAEHRIEENKKKMLPSEEDLNPNLKFYDNQIIRILEESAELRHQSEDLKANWMGDEKQELIRKMYNHIRQSEIYFEFMNNEKSGFEEDKEFMVQLFKTEIANFPLLFDNLEERSVYWMDDIDLACSMVIKTIKSFKEVELKSEDTEVETESEEKAGEVKNSILPLYKPNDDEEEFLADLLRQAIKLRPENLKLIDVLTDNWELDRIAKMDVLLMELAITELVTFSNIPTKVTLNEYIEISKFYSTPKSNQFINGVLDKAIAKLESEGKINKIGRGLMK